MKMLISAGPLLLSFLISAHAAITGQWDFKKGDITATIGPDMNYLDAETSAGTKFGSTAFFGIPPIGGQITNVMKFPKLNTETGGFIAPVGAAANGGGFAVNQYTVIMDVLFPTNSSGKTRAIFVTDNHGEFLADSGNGIGFAGGSSDGAVTPNVWHRIVFAIDTGKGLAKYVDGVKVGESTIPGGVDGSFSISSAINLFDDASTNSESGYIASMQFRDQKLSDGLIAALGVPTAAGILAGPTPNPYVDSVSPVSDLRVPGRSSVTPDPIIQIVLADGQAAVKTNSILLKFNGQAVQPSVSKSGIFTTITYPVTNFLAALSSNSVTLAYQDTTSTPLGTQFAFFVGPYIQLPANAALPLGSGGARGFLFRVVQAPAEDTGVKLQSSFARALRQLDGTLVNTNGAPFANEATPGPNSDGSYSIDGTIAFELTGGSLTALPNATIIPFPGIPGANGGTDNFADETVAYLELSAGTHVFGMDVGIDRVDSPPGADDGYRLYSGSNPRDFFSTLVGQFVRTGDNFNDRQNTNQFTFAAPVAGLYPFRLVHWQNNLGANLAWYSVDDGTGDRILINDSSDSRAIKAYRAVNAAVSEPFVAEVAPPPDAAGVAATAPITILLSDGDLQVKSGTVKLSLNGADVPATITKTGRVTTVIYIPNATRTSPTNLVRLIYSDNAAPSASLFTNQWAFTSVVAGGGSPKVTGQWDFNGNLAATVGKDLLYLDGPSGLSVANSVFGTTTSFGIPDINGSPARVLLRKGTIDKSIGYIMDHGISPNGGGQLVNQYTIIFDIFKKSGTTTLFNCQNTNNTTDGSIFWQNNDIGQGSGGYVSKGTATSGAWHRIALAADMGANPPVITKFVDGIKQQDWIQPGLDLPRRSWQHTVLLIADGDGDDMADTYISSVQVRNGKLTDAQLVALGGSSAGKIPQNLPDSNVTGQWDFQNGDLSATVGKDLLYLDGPSGSSPANTVYGTTTSLGIPDINGTPAKIMLRKGIIDKSVGYIMDHGISPNGGGQLVNQYTIIFDIFKKGGTTTLFNCQNTNNTTDGSIFWQANDIGQGAGGYVSLGTATSGAWHRISLAADMGANPPVITKFVDGIKQQDWVQPGLDLPRRSWQHTVLLIADGDGDDMSDTYIRGIQVSSVKLSDAQLIALGGPSASGIPVVVTVGVPLSTSLKGAVVTISWPLTASGFILESADNLTNPVWQPVAGVANNSVTVTASTGQKFYRLRQ